MGKTLVLNVRRAKMLPGVADIRVPHAPGGHASAAARGLAPDLARAPVLAPAMAQHQRGNQRFELAFITNDDDLLVVSGVFGEHAQVEHGARATRVFDNDVGAVENVGHGLAVRAGVALIQMVHALVTRRKNTHGLFLQDKFHQVEIVAAFFHQGAAGVGREAVPVIHLGVEGLAVFADRHLVQCAHRPLVRETDHFGHRWHVAVFLGDPDDGFAGFGFLNQLGAIGHRGAKRFFDQQVRAGGQCMAHDLDVGEIGSGDDHRITQARFQQVLVTLKNFGLGCRAAEQFKRGFPAGKVRVGQGRDGAGLQRQQIQNMLTAHAAAANDAVTD